VSRLEAFGLHVLQCNGHDIQDLTRCLEDAKQVQGLPVMVVMDTVGGKGVSFMEGKYEWHDKVPSKDELKLALIELGVDHE
jgi:transketolase